jgi:hypothetical protein
VDGIRLVEEDPVPLMEEFELTLGRAPMFDGLVAAARMLPTILFASPRIDPTMLVACCIWPLTSRRMLDALAVPSPETEGPTGSGVASSPAASDDAALATSLAPPNMAETTAAMSPIRLSSMPCDTSLDSGFAAAWTGLCPLLAWVFSLSAS